MPKRTLLEVVKDVAENINSDEVSTLVNAAIETNDITKLVMRTLEDILNRNDWEFLRDRPKQLEAGTNAIELAIPADVFKVQNVRYRLETDTEQTGFRTLIYMHPKDFMERLQKNIPTAPNTATVTLASGVELYPKTNAAPRYWTSFDEKNIVFDSYDEAQNPTGVDATDSAILATVYLDWSGATTVVDDVTQWVDSWIPDIPEKLFTLWVQESSADAAVKLRQAEDPREERKARRSYVQAIKREPVTNKDEGSKEVNYGR